MRMRQDHVRDVDRYQPMGRQLRDQGAAYAEGADIHQHDPPMSAQQDDAAPSQAAMADGLAGKPCTKMSI